MFLIGIRRSPQDEEGNFDIFDDPKSLYSTFNFHYSNQAFDRLHNLMEFNTLLHVDVRLNLATNFFAININLLTL